MTSFKYDINLTTPGYFTVNIENKPMSLVIFCVLS